MEEGGCKMKTLNPRRSPYVGPRPFEENEQIFGRSQDILNLSYLILSERIVLLYSPSGAGKSSLIQAGLKPELKSKLRFLPVIRVYEDPPDELTAKENFNRYIYSVLVSLEEGLPEELRLPPEELATLTLSEYLSQRRRPESKKGEIPDQPKEDSEPDYEILVFDQFEEILTIAPNDVEGKQDFFEQVGEALGDRRRWALFVAREDYVAAFDPYKDAIPTRFSNRYRLDLLTDEQALDAIKLPAAKEGVQFTDAAAQRLVDDLRTMKVQRADGTITSELGPYVEPVQLQVACERLWKNLAATDFEITDEHIKELGDVNKSLGRYYAEQVALASKGDSALERHIREWFATQLIMEQGEQGMRNQVMMSAEKSGGLDNKIISFLDKRHLVRAERRHGTTWYELSHDRLVDPVRENNREWFEQKLSVLQRQAALWIKHDRADYLLLRAEELEKAERWADEHDTELLETEKDFLQACRNVRTLEREKEEANQHELEMARQIASEQARSARRATQFSIVAVVLVIIAVIASIFAYQQKGRADVKANDAVQAQKTAQALGDEAIRQAAISRSYELSALARNQLGQRFDASILLSIEAFRKDDNPQTQNTLITSFEKSAGITRFSSIPQSDNNPVLSPDGTIAATMGQDGISLWGLDGSLRGEHFGPFGGPPAPAYAVAFSPNGKTLATSSKDGSIALWDTASGELSGSPLRKHTDWVNNVAFSPDGRLLASASDDDTIILWDLADPRNPQVIGGPISAGYNVNALVFDPRGKIIATGDPSGDVVLWDISNLANPLEVGNRLSRQSGAIFSNGLAFSEDGNLLASGSLDDTIILWDLTDPAVPKLISTLGLSNPVYTVAISPDGKTLAAGGESGELALWDIANRSKPVQITRLNGHEDIVNSVAFSPDGKTLASAGLDGKVILWDVATGANLGRLEKEITSPANVAAFNPSGDRLAVTYEDGSTLIWDVSAPERPQQVGSSLQYPGLPTSMEFSSDGSILTISDQNGNVLLNVGNRAVIGPGDILFQDPKGRFLVYQLSGSAPDSSTTQVFDAISRKPAGPPAPGAYLSISQDGSVLAYQTSDTAGNTSINLWDVVKGNAIGSPVPGSFRSLSQDGTTLAYDDSDEAGNRLITFLNTANGASTSVRGEYVALSQDGKVLLYKAMDEQGNPVLHIRNRKTGDDRVSESPLCDDPIFSPDGRVLACQTYDQDNNSLFSLFDTSSWSPIGTPVRGITYVGQSQEGNTLAYQVYDGDTGEYNIIVVDTTTPGQVSQTGDINGEFKAFTQDGRILVYQAGPETRQWDTSSRLPTNQTLEGDFLGMGQDGKTLILRQGSLIESVDLTQASTLGSPLFRESAEPVGVAALSPDGTVLAKFDAAGILLQDAASGAALGDPFNEHIGGVSSAFFGPEGTSVTFSGDDGEIKTWDTGSQRLSGDTIPAAPGSTLLPSPDGRTLAVTDTQSGEITLWDLATRTQIDQPVAGDWAVFSPDGNFVAISNWDKRTSTVLDLGNREHAPQTFPGYSASFSPTGKTLVVGDYYDDKAKLWDLSTDKQIGDDIPGYYGVFSPDGKVLSNYDTNDTTTLWDLASRKPIGKPFPGYGYGFSPDGKVLAVGSSQGNSTTLRNLADGSQVGDPFPGTSAFFSPGGNFLAVRGYEGNSSATTLWEWGSHQQIGETISGTSYAFSPDGKTLAYPRDTGVIVWNGDSQSAPGERLLPYPGAINGMTFSKDGQTLAIYGSGGLALYDLNTRQRLGDPVGSAGRVNSLKFSPNGQLLASIGDDGIILTGVHTQEKIGDVIPGNNATFSPDSSTMAVGEQDNTTLLIDTSNGNKVGKAIFGTNPTFSPDGKTIATYDSQAANINLWNRDTQEAVNTEPIRGNAVRFSPDGKIMAIVHSVPCGSSGQGCNQILPAITLWSLNPLSQIDKGEIPIKSVCSADQPNCVLAVFSHDGKTLAYNDTGGIILWDMGKNHQVGDPFSVSGEVSDLGFIRNGQLLASEDSTGFTTFWDLASHSPFGDRIPGFFQLDGMEANRSTFLIQDGEQWSLWKFDPQEWINELCAKVGRDLTQDEWDTYGFSNTEPYRPTCSQKPLEVEPTPAPTP